MTWSLPPFGFALSLYPGVQISTNDHNCSRVALQTTLIMVLESGEDPGNEVVAGELRCVVGQDTLLSQCLSPPRSIRVKIVLLYNFILRKSESDSVLLERLHKSRRTGLLTLLPDFVSRTLESTKTEKLTRHPSLSKSPQSFSSSSDRESESLCRYLIRAEKTSSESLINFSPSEKSLLPLPRQWLLPHGEW